LQSKVTKREVDTKLLIVLEAGTISILRAKNFDYWFRFLQVVED